MEHDDALFDSVAVLALGAMPQSEAQQLWEHVSTCGDCLRELRGLRTAADAVGLSAEAQPGEVSELQSARMKARLMRVVRADRALPEPSTVPAIRRSRPWLAYLAAAAAIAVAIGSALSTANLRSENDSQRSQLADLHRQVDTQSAELAQTRTQARAQAEQSLALAEAVSNGRQFPVAGGAVVKSRAHLILALGHLRPLPKGRVYQAWTLAPGAKAVAPSLTFTPDARGAAIVPLPVNPSRVAAVAVSVEPAGGSRAPTTHPILLRKLS